MPTPPTYDKDDIHKMLSMWRQDALDLSQHRQMMRELREREVSASVEYQKKMAAFQGAHLAAIRRIQMDGYAQIAEAIVIGFDSLRDKSFLGASLERLRRKFKR